MFSAFFPFLYVFFVFPFSQPFNLVFFFFTCVFSPVLLASMEIFIPSKFIYEFITLSSCLKKSLGVKMQCALCKNKECLKGKNCSVIKSGLEYGSKDLKSLQVSAWLEADLTKRTRVEEIVIYAKKLGYGKIGVAFCIDYEREARLVYEILSRYFEVFSVCCKVCGFGKADLGLRKCEGARFDVACNPIGQALLLNDDETDLNIMLGMKTGYDILFAAHSDAPSVFLPVQELSQLGSSDIDMIE